MLTLCEELLATVLPDLRFLMDMPSAWILVRTFSLSTLIMGALGFPVGFSAAFPDGFPEVPEARREETAP